MNPSLMEKFVLGVMGMLLIFSSIAIVDTIKVRNYRSGIIAYAFGWIVSTTIILLISKHKSLTMSMGTALIWAVLIYSFVYPPVNYFVKKIESGRSHSQPMNYCFNCGKRIQARDKFCANCGEKVAG